MHPTTVRTEARVVRSGLQTSDSRPTVPVCKPDFNRPVARQALRDKNNNKAPSHALEAGRKPASVLFDVQSVDCHSTGTCS